MISKLVIYNLTVKWLRSNRSYQSRVSIMVQK